MEVPQGPRSILETILKEVADSWKWVCDVDISGPKAKIKLEGLSTCSPEPTM